MNKGVAYCVGVGPGDPELLTVKAVRLIREGAVIAVPGEEAKESLAYRIAAAAVPELAGKEVLAVPMPMTRDRAALEQAHRAGAEMLETVLSRGRDVVYLTLGDPTVYCTFSYLQHILEADGFTVELVPGVPSFCAAAARLGQPLTEWDQVLHVVPGAHMAEDALAMAGTCVLMKSAGRMPQVKEALRQSGRDAAAVENATMETEKIYRGVEDIPDDAGYFTLIVAKQRRDND